MLQAKRIYQSVFMIAATVGSLAACGPSKWQETKNAADPLRLKMTPRQQQAMHMPPPMPVRQAPLRQYQPVYTSGTVPGRMAPRIRDEETLEGTDIRENEEFEVVDPKPKGPNNEYLLVRTKRLENSGGEEPVGPEYRYIPVDYLATGPAQQDDSGAPPRIQPQRPRTQPSKHTQSRLE